MLSKAGEEVVRDEKLNRDAIVTRKETIQYPEQTPKALLFNVSHFPHPNDTFLQLPSSH